MRVEATGILLLCLANAFLYHFICMWKFGEFFITEPNKNILIGETIFISFCVGFAVYCLWSKPIKEK